MHSRTNLTYMFLLLSKMIFFRFTFFNQILESMLGIMNWWWIKFYWT